MSGFTIPAFLALAGAGAGLRWLAAGVGGWDDVACGDVA